MRVRRSGRTGAWVVGWDKDGMWMGQVVEEDEEE